MPRPRFGNLPAAKQQWIIECAAREFAAAGFENASLNRILEQAGISKGSAYYYFDSKADLFLTVIQVYLSEVGGTIEGLALEELTAENYWHRLGEEYQRQWLMAYERPWLMGAAKAAGKLSEEALSDEGLAAVFNQVKGWLGAVFGRGQELGVVRTDLPDELLFALVQAVDDTNDRWLLAHHAELRREEVAEIAGRAMDMLRRLLAP